MSDREERVPQSADGRPRSPEPAPGPGLLHGGVLAVCVFVGTAHVVAPRSADEDLRRFVGAHLVDHREYLREPAGAVRAASPVAGLTRVVDPSRTSAAARVTFSVRSRNGGVPAAATLSVRRIPAAGGSRPEVLVASSPVIACADGLATTELPPGRYEVRVADATGAEGARVFSVSRAAFDRRLEVELGEAVECGIALEGRFAGRVTRVAVLGPEPGLVTNWAASGGARVAARVPAMERRLLLAEDSSGHIVGVGEREPAATEVRLRCDAPADAARHDAWIVLRRDDGPWIAAARRCPLDIAVPGRCVVLPAPAPVSRELAVTLPESRVPHEGHVPDVWLRAEGETDVGGTRARYVLAERHSRPAARVVLPRSGSVRVIFESGHGRGSVDVAADADSIVVRREDPPVELATAAPDGVVRLLLADGRSEVAPADEAGVAELPLCRGSRAVLTDWPGKDPRGPAVELCVTAPRDAPWDLASVPPRTGSCVIRLDTDWRIVGSLAVVPWDLSDELVSAASVQPDAPATVLPLIAPGRAVLQMVARSGAVLAAVPVEFPGGTLAQHVEAALPSGGIDVTSLPSRARLRVFAEIDGAWRPFLRAARTEDLRSVALLPGRYLVASVDAEGRGSLAYADVGDDALAVPQIVCDAPCRVRVRPSVGTGGAIAMSAEIEVRVLMGTRREVLRVGSRGPDGAEFDLPVGEASVVAVFQGSSGPVRTVLLEKGTSSIDVPLDR